MYDCLTARYARTTEVISRNSESIGMAGSFRTVQVGSRSLGTMPAPVSLQPLWSKVHRIAPVLAAVGLYP
jgi:hypothetical protein